MRLQAEISAVDYEGRGVARVDGKTVFVGGALPGETVVFKIVRSKKHFDEAETLEVVGASRDRVEPRCRHFGVCGGCVLQHASPQAQVAYKQRVMEEQLWRLGGVSPERISSPVYGTPWAYRYRARLGVARDAAGRISVGFRARRGSDVVGLEECPVLPPHVSAVLPRLRDVLQKMAGQANVRFVEFLTGREVTVLNVCASECLSEKDKAVLKQFSDRHLQAEGRCWQIWLQSGRKEAVPFYPELMPDLYYEIAEFGIKMPFKPGDFTQVNPEMNALMIRRVMRLLDPQKGERIADLFCGLGNFSLPAAKSGAEVLGVEGAACLVERARRNAEINHCADRICFEKADLFQATEKSIGEWGRLDKILLDPPRSGAYEIVKALKGKLPERIVYVSCNPATFARDAGVIIKKGYKFKEVSVLNMFPQTSHVESVGLFLR